MTKALVLPSKGASRGRDLKKWKLHVITICVIYISCVCIRELDLVVVFWKFEDLLAAEGYSY